MFKRFFGKGNVAKFMENLYHEIKNEIENQNQSLVEYGNFRKGEKWNQHIGDNLVFTFCIDLFSERPAVYQVQYNVKEKEFNCEAKIGAKTGMHNLLECHTDSKKELKNRLHELAMQIPSIRERAMREYLYGLSLSRPKRRWKRFFRKENPYDSLCGVIDELKQQGKISEAEAEKMKNYVSHLTS
ncbi:MAG: hypothetical protein D6767_05870 [Candidatus Hydrogenedentota bacterium]|nr:MAG: hypothetical protein D6767_05870 [Candidatus Hydrogenedentota bacterium]